MARWRRSLVMALAAAACATFVWACRSILDADDFSVRGGECGAFTFVDASCLSCGESRCCAEGTRCRESATCAALYDCLATCLDGEPSCQSQCAELYPSDETAAELASCRGRACAVECRDCGGAQNPKQTNDAAACAQCLRTKCCETFAACQDDVPCSALFACGGRTDPSDLCPVILSDPAVVDAARCAIEACAVECAGVPDYACVGAYDFAQAPGTLTQLVRLVDGVQQTRVEGIELLVCLALDYPCDDPFDTAVTDDAGEALINVPPSAAFLMARATPTHPAHVLMGTRPLWDGHVLVHVFNTFDTMVAFTAATGGTFDASRSHVLMTLESCGSMLGGGATFVASSADAGTLGFYFDGGLPVLMSGETDESGNGGFLNLPPGPVRIDAFVDSELVATTNFVALPGTVNNIRLLPRPASDTP